jgi:formylglycine-generating enzyme required for sulfatase activity
MEELDGINESLRHHAAPGSLPWFVNSQGQTMVVIADTAPFLMGSPLTEIRRQGNEPQHLKKLGRTFALAAKQVTMADYKRSLGLTYDPKAWAPAPDCPAMALTWHQAAAYCNWLSEQDGIARDQWCYEKQMDGTMKARDRCLELTGYRLPTEAEMEFAARAGSVTSHFFGEPVQLLGKYAWFAENSSNHTWPVGSKKPNDLGFFDMYGNVATWCQDVYAAYPKSKGNQPFDDKPPTVAPKAKTPVTHVLRGFSYNTQADRLRSAGRMQALPSDHYLDFGVRPARTLLAKK